jgi:release factor glutamine methyltransferase
MTVSQALHAAAERLQSTEVDTPRLDAQLILAWVLHARREDLAREPERPLSAREQVIFDKAIALRALRRPLPYITGEAWFYGRPFKVNRAVLIPRPETELLVEIAVGERSRKPADAPLKIADIGTGSGCIAVSIALEMLGAQFVAADISRLALLVAAKNVRRYDLASRIELRQGDLCAPLGEERLDIIVSNPPYIPRSDEPSLMPEVRDYEPALALYGDEEGEALGHGSVESLRRDLMRQAKDHLVPGGLLAIEVGMGQAPDATEEMGAIGYSDIRAVRDHAGTERVVSGRV